MKPIGLTTYIGLMVSAVVSTGGLVALAIQGEKAQQSRQSEVNSARQEGYREGFEEAVLACERGNMIKGPIILTGIGASIEGKTIYVVNIIKQQPVIKMTNAAFVTIRESRIYGAPRQTVLSDETGPLNRRPM
jgi:hypothetical protein